MEKIKFSGIVKKGQGRGKVLGFPTANIEIPFDIDDGIYAGIVSCNSREYHSLIFVGAAKTFGESKRLVEIYILDFSGDIYGDTLNVYILKKIRDNQKFHSKDDLIAQMKEDERLAREFFTNYNVRNNLQGEV